MNTNLTNTAPVGRLPWDLGQWIEPMNLAGLSWELGGAMGIARLCKTDKTLHDPQLMLAVLVYSYGRGILASVEVAERLWHGEGRRLFPVVHPIAADDFRRFRRARRQVIQQGLVQVFHQTWLIRHQACASLLAAPNERFTESRNLVNLETTRHFVCEADERLTRAAQLDSMELDSMELEA